MATTAQRPPRPIDPTGALLRANPSLDLVPIERLPAARRRLLAGPEPDPELFGVLRPASSGGGARDRLVDRDTARLFHGLRAPRRATGIDGGEAPDGRDLTRLVLDGVLELETADGFVSGPRSLLFLTTPRPIVARNAVARLSHEALRYGERLALGRPSALSARLYRYGRLPLTAGWRRRLRSGADRAAVLGLEAGSATARLLARHWRPRPDGDGFWQVWLPRAQRAEPASETTRPSYKLYVSPRPEALGDALRVTVAAMASTRPRPLKVVADAGGFLRPDKLVVYLPRRADLRTLVTTLRPALDGLPAHGVPFAAGLDDGLLLAWGPEPPRHEQTLPWLQPESWRLWLTNRLALAVFAFRHAPVPELSGWRYAAERLRLEGVDPETFCPEAGLWHNVKENES